jgi:outer membrane protein assembly factor BamD
MIRKLYLSLSIVSILGIWSCSSYSKLVKSTDNEAKYEAAIDYFEKKDYNRSLELFDLLQSAYRGTTKGEDISFYSAYCYYHIGDYTVASFYFKRYAETFPTSPRAEECLYMNAYCYYLDSPKPSLDQANTTLAITELQLFTDTFPRSERIAECNKLIDELRKKLELKSFNIALMYYRMEDYMASITSFELLLKKFPDTDRREEILKYMAKGYYEFADRSIPAKQRERYEKAIDSYNNLLYLYPESEYLKGLDKTVNQTSHQKLEKLR